MRRLRRLALGQRIVLVVAWGLALRLVGVFIVSGRNDGPHGGWFGYSPNTDQVFVPGSGLNPGVSLAVWLVLLAVWALVAVWLLGPTDRS